MAVKRKTHRTSPRKGIMVTIFILPAIIISAFALRALLKHKKKIGTSLFWETIALAPLLFLTYETGMAALWSFQNISCR